MSEYAEAHKIPEYKLRTLNNRDENFYELVGPLLSRREIVAEIGNHVWDDDNKTWIIAVAQTKVLGMCAVKNNEVCSFYVEPNSRGQSIGFALLRKTLNEFKQATKATCNETSLSLFELMGFKQTGNRGRFITVVRDV